MITKVIQFIKFGFVGMSNTIISLSIYYILIYCNFNYIIANSLGYIISSLSGYFLSKIWVFNNKGSKNMQIFKYYITYILAFLINSTIVYLCVDIIGLSEIIAPVIAMAITIPFNFFMSKLWVFKNKYNFK